MMDSGGNRAHNARPDRALSDCLFSQYTFTVAGIMSATGYALYKRPKNGIGIMIVTGMAGGLADLAYGWTSACRPQVELWQRHQEELTKQLQHRAATENPLNPDEKSK